MFGTVTSRHEKDQGKDEDWTTETSQVGEGRTGVGDRDRGKGGSYGPQGVPEQEPVEKRSPGVSGKLSKSASVKRFHLGRGPV